MQKWASGVCDEAAVKQAGGEVLPDGHGIRLHGWTISSRKAPISKDAELDGLRQELQHTLSVPEQLFGNSYLRLTHEASGVTVDFSALDALRQWKADALPPTRVEKAQGWLHARRADVESSGAVALDYDWTYTTTYSGSVHRERDSSNGAGPALEWAPSTEQLNRAPLLARDPILFYDEVPLYESELDDNGVSQLSVKVRVMPRCWFALLRFWLRVDGVLVRLYEARWLAELGDGPPRLQRELRHCEGTFADLAAAGAPPARAPAWADAEAAATTAWKDVTLTEKKSESPSVRRLIFALPHKQQLLGLPAGQHVVARVPKRGGGFWERPYNPTSTDAQPGIVEFLVKVTPTGEVGKALDRLQPGDKIALKGPFGKFVYKPGKYKAIGLLAGGTGLTPMIRLIHSILSNPEDRVKLRLILACNSPEDLLMKKELDAFAAGYYGKFKVFYVVNAAPAEGHHLSLGVIDGEMLSKYINTEPGPDVLTVRCGPPAFLADVASVLQETGHGASAQVELAEEVGHPL
ncbi:hypothetical protein WJX81_003867 [Elliptochloris bilobata]|uniref:FAD-binding FR-type domain-containing protein n=1 Tax=Elliptochloris bilobata TaxID=381761 RepID=A0AAW1RTC4_9CHLO